MAAATMPAASTSASARSTGSNSGGRTERIPAPDSNQDFSPGARSALRTALSTAGRKAPPRAQITSPCSARPIVGRSTTGWWDLLMTSAAVVRDGSTPSAASASSLIAGSSPDTVALAISSMADGRSAASTSRRSSKRPG